MDNNNINSVLARLEEMSIEPYYLIHFADPAEQAKIIRFEKEFKINLPESYKKFLKKHNGGMLLYDYQSESLQTDYEMFKGEAIYFLSIEEITERYTALKNREWKVSKEKASPYPIIPFCSLPNNELLVFIHGSKSAKESPVFDAFHEEFPSTWGIVAPDFTNFLANYLETLGHPGTMGDEEKAVASDYFDEVKEQKETPEEILSRTAEDLIKEPDHAFYHYERAAAFQELGNISEAYQAIQKALEFEPEDAFYNFIQGEILNESQKYRAALISFDTAVKLKPNDTYYLCSRAAALYRLNKFKPSINDCNQAIKMD